MKYRAFVLLAFCCIAFLFNDNVIAATHFETNFAKELNQICRLKLSQTIEKSIANKEQFNSTGFQYFTFSIRLSAYGEINGQLSLACPVTDEAKNLVQENLAHNLSPKSILADEDSGGRYSRLIAWEKPIVGIGWEGKVAYVHQILGDGIKMPTNNLLMLCPNKNILCIRFETLTSKKLSDRQIKFLIKEFEKTSFITN